MQNPLDLAAGGVPTDAPTVAQISELCDLGRAEVGADRFEPAHLVGMAVCRAVAEGQLAGLVRRNRDRVVDRGHPVVTRVQHLQNLGRSRPELRCPEIPLILDERGGRCGDGGTILLVLAGDVVPAVVLVHILCDDVAAEVECRHTFESIAGVVGVIDPGHSIRWHTHCVGIPIGIRATRVMPDPDLFDTPKIIVQVPE